MAYITQSFLCKMRRTMFERMQNLPIGYFDTHKHGDIMSYYTNDIDTLRQLVSQALPTLIRASVIVGTVLVLMVYYSVWLTLIILVGVLFMLFVSKKFGGGSAKFFANRYVSFTVDGPCTVTIATQSSGSDARTLKLVDASGAQIGSYEAGTSVTVSGINIDSAGTYSVGSAGSGIYIYYIFIEYFE
jgi:ABC-type multidrug transport system fused ATPase/permease subunit